MQPEVRKPTEEEMSSAKTWPTWQKEPSEFPYEYSSQEQFLVIEGQATVECADGTVSFTAGDFVTMPAGLKCTWKITEKIVKHYNFG